MSKDTHDFGKAVNLANVQELKRFHLKTKAGINEHQNLKREMRGSHFWQRRILKQHQLKLKWVGHNLLTLILFSIGIPKGKKENVSIGTLGREGNPGVLQDEGHLYSCASRPKKGPLPWLHPCTPCKKHLKTERYIGRLSSLSLVWSCFWQTIYCYGSLYSVSCALLEKESFVLMAFYRFWVCYCYFYYCCFKMLQAAMEWWDRNINIWIVSLAGSGKFIM